ncbi:uncharacterized protein LOC121853885 [Homarus americanus]|uniref:Uncharacterized protein n=1 Tax=Homarus americanus TaxID=6706 RepID=A0A8J5JIH3_HOMAM|nr:uncharacterized protein LOC121853885 [Homarus americanus]KAG7156265.1 hypothetical protein Hamer_G005985 [Homarus americanus]
MSFVEKFPVKVPSGGDDNILFRFCVGIKRWTHRSVHQSAFNTHRTVLQQARLPIHLIYQVTMAVNALAPVMYQLQESLRSVDLAHWVSQLDFKTVGLLAVVVVGVVFLVNLFTKSYSPYGRSLLSSAAHAWDNRDQLGLTDVLSGSRSLEPLSNVLDALADAVMKWEEPEVSTIRNRVPLRFS